jgi:hypothetical protein
MSSSNDICIRLLLHALCLAKNRYPLALFFFSIFFGLQIPVSATISPKMEKDLVLLTQIRCELVNVKTNISRSNNELENPVRDLLWSKINRNST